MKKKYVKPNAKLVDFSYDEQITAASGCKKAWETTIDDPDFCSDWVKGKERKFSECVLYTTLEV